MRQLPLLIALLALSGPVRATESINCTAIQEEDLSAVVQGQFLISIPVAKEMDYGVNYAERAGLAAEGAIHDVDDGLHRYRDRDSAAMKSYLCSKE